MRSGSVALTTIAWTAVQPERSPGTAAKSVDCAERLVVAFYFRFKELTAIGLLVGWWLGGGGSPFFWQNHSLGTVGVGGHSVGGADIYVVDGNELLGTGTRYGVGSGVRVGGLA